MTDAQNPTQFSSDGEALWLVPPTHNGQAPGQLFVMFHGQGGEPADLLWLARTLQAQWPGAAIMALRAPYPAGASEAEGRQWFVADELNADELAGQVAAGLPPLLKLIRRVQAQWQIAPAATALFGLGQGGLVALELSAADHALAGRVIAFSAGYASLPQAAAPETSVHLLHGAEDDVVPPSSSQDAYDRIQELEGDATLDILPDIGHELNVALVTRAIERLRTHVPLHIWQSALMSARQSS
ncbi:esterase [Kerstersia gyiorum]|uniref:esterase n=1 Tax=Kerstersia gyiorum TaxID=206506 RepID=UPI00209FCF8C|nr:esterase [Kerstersia gyiorum]MCP1679565.1 phospholipase/carboxylesterase [Kerstersia gyiorum]MCP1824068.1 phospholipase/carboxylesterase [Kerstersia gyiorum]MCP1827613.1 phospholipase/carboxylesterase [Kerstersia gyiorum]MCW2451142.1 phospholipase/carboxylesterase [Kerstersia gyiorum]